MTITTSNYLEIAKGINFTSLPKALQDGHNMAVEVAGNGWKFYHADEDIKEVIDIYFSKLASAIPVPAKKAASDQRIFVVRPGTSTPKKTEEPKVTVTKKAVVPQGSGGRYSRESKLNLYRGLLAKIEKATSEIDLKPITQSIYDYSSNEQLDKQQTENLNLMVGKAINKFKSSSIPDHPKKATTKAKKEPKPKKAKPTQADKEEKQKALDAGRQIISAYDAQMNFFRRFISFDGKPIKIRQVESLHKALSKAILDKKLKKSDNPNAGLIQEVANKTAEIYKAMVQQNINAVSKFTYKERDLLEKVKGVFDKSKINYAVNILKRFVNLEGQPVDMAKVDALIKLIDNGKASGKLYAPNEYLEHLSSTRTYLQKVKDGEVDSFILIEPELLSGLGGLLGIAGLGCAGKPDCGCDAKSLAGVKVPTRKEKVNAIHKRMPWLKKSTLNKAAKAVESVQKKPAAGRAAGKKK